jgi:hypothetical protein
LSASHCSASLSQLRLPSWNVAYRRIDLQDAGCASRSGKAADLIEEPLALL